MPVTHGVAGSSPVHTAKIECKSSEELVLRSFFMSSIKRNSVSNRGNSEVVGYYFLPLQNLMVELRK